jgi:hypothetical protein
MSSAQTPAPRSASDNVATIVLLVAHSVLVGFTLLTVAGLVLTDQDPHDQCRIHGLDCDRGARVREAVGIGVIGSAVLVILDLVLTRLLARRRLSFVVPLLCCIGQLIAAGAVFVLGPETV